MNRLRNTLKQPERKVWKKEYKFKTEKSMNKYNE